ncbi:hypothetical protein ACI792_13180 [Blastococcus sp. SYSU DS0669]
MLVGYRIEDPDAGIDEARPVLCGTVTQASADTAAPAPSPTPAPEAPTTAQVERTPVGGVAAGGGSTAGTEHQGFLALGGTALVGAAVAAGMAVRRSRGTR